MNKETKYTPINPADLKCKICGCTEEHVCEGGCCWRDINLCCKCAETQSQKEAVEEYKALYVIPWEAEKHLLLQELKEKVEKASQKRENFDWDKKGTQEFNKVQEYRKQGYDSAQKEFLQIISDLGRRE